MVLKGEKLMKSPSSGGLSMGPMEVVDRNWKIFKIVFWGGVLLFSLLFVALILKVI